MPTVLVPSVAPNNIPLIANRNTRTLQLSRIPSNKPIYNRQERPYEEARNLHSGQPFFIAKAYSNVGTHVCCIQMISPAIIIKFSHYFDAVGWVTGTHPAYKNLAPAIPKVLRGLLPGN